MIYNEYIIEDRTTAENYSIKITDGQLNWSVTLDVASPEPIFEDAEVPGNYYKLFIDDGELAWEVTATVQNDVIELLDTLNVWKYKLIVGFGQFSWVHEVPATIAAGPRYSLVLSDRNFSPVKHLTKDVKQLSWQYDRIGGVGRCTLSMPKEYKTMDAFISPDYDLQIFLPNEANDGTNLVYRGYAESHHPVAGDKDTITLQFFGYVGQLSRIRVNKIYTDTDVNDIVKDILDTFVVPNTSITYDTEDIAAPNFVVDSLIFDTMASSAITTLAELARFAEFGVDVNRKFFFKARSEEIRHYTRFKVDLNTYDSINDYSKIINRLVVKGGSGFEETVNNTESQASFGLRTKILSNSAISSSSVANQYGTTILLDQAKVNRRATIQFIKNRRFFESSQPIGKISIIELKVGQAKIYDEDYYSNFKYGGQPSFQINSIKYKLSPEGTNVSMDVGESRPDIANSIKQLEFQLSEVRNQ